MHTAIEIIGYVVAVFVFVALYMLSLLFTVKREDRERWQRAMSEYRSLPNDDPRRGELAAMMKEIENDALDSGRRYQLRLRRRREH